MNKNLFSTIDSFRNISVAVIGESILDSYLSGTPQNLCREAPVPAVAVDQRSDTPGGAANTALNAAALGARVRFLSVTGDDPEGASLRSLLEAHGVDTGMLIRADNRRTLTKNRIIACSQMVARFDQGSTSLLERKTEELLIAALPAAFASNDAVIISDYGYGLFTSAVIRALSGARAASRAVFIDSRSPVRFRELKPAAVKPNYEETVSLLGIAPHPIPGKRPEQIAAYADRLLSLTGARVCAVTLDTDGAVILEKNAPCYRTYARAASAIRATGAGDTFTAAFALALTAGADTAAAAELASAAAGVVTGKELTAACSGQELKAGLSAGNKYAADQPSIAALCALYRAQGKRIVFTNGCFDILHREHITHLSRSKELGDTLIVGVNSDSSVSRLKGEGRPVHKLADRIQILSALSCVDHIAVFDDDTAEALIRDIRPDIFTKGGNYSRAQLPEAALLRSLETELIILPRIDTYPSADILRHVRDNGGRL